MLQGKKILFSGVFPGHERSDLEAIAVNAGAILLSAVSKNLDLLIAGDKMGPKKLEQANALGIPVIGLDEFLNKIKKENSAGSDSRPVFWTITPDGNQDPQALLSQLNNLGWPHFSPESDGVLLREILLTHERNFGITACHETVFEKLKADMRLLHPFGHEEPFRYDDISPDGKWLATGSWSEPTMTAAACCKSGISKQAVQSTG